MDTHKAAQCIFALMLVSLVTACSQPALSAPAPVQDAHAAAVQQLRPGDSWSGMTLSTGSHDAASIWTLCHPTPLTDDQAASECHVPSAPLAVGPSSLAWPETINQAEWALFDWALSIDGRPVALDAFGTFEFMFPRKASHGRDALFIFRAWDVVAAAPARGAHTLQGSVTRRMHPGKGVGTLTNKVEWVVNLVVE
jgi:hypothetical protein